jgi:trans-2,3-dihydro-3-hydroxyanthranilate isomerase
MRIIDVYQVDAFTDQLFGGNPAGVVTNADILTDDEMQLIAREMNLSETAFVLEPSDASADLQMRFFTPASEVDFCGHATVATLSQLAALSMFGLGQPGTHSTTVQTAAETLTMSVTNSPERAEIMFTAPSVSMESYTLQGEAFAEKFGIPSALLKDGATVLIDKNLRYIYIPVVSLEALGQQSFNFDRITEYFADENIVVFCLFTNETIQEASDLHARGLAPLVGVPEDPFTGSMQAGLIHAAKHNGTIPGDLAEIHTEQGHFINRPGYAVVHHDGITDTATITAQAVPVFATHMELV